jgi:hypothetical protein
LDPADTKVIDRKEYIFTEWMYKTELNLKLALIEAYFEHLKKTDKKLKNSKKWQNRIDLIGFGS